jgi:hypothetical protein
MPPLLSKPSGAAPTALIFITLGALVTVWSIIWFMYLENQATVPVGVRYFCFGLLATGLVLLAIGFGTGRIGRAARVAELPPDEVTPTVDKAGVRSGGTVVRNS